jgi:hypothetical protein
MTGNLNFVAAVALMTVMSAFAARSEDAGQETLIKALAGAKISLQQGIAQVAKGTEVPTEAKYEMDKGKLALTVYTSAKGFDTAAEDNSFNEYGGDATAAAWTPDKEVLADLKHIARSAQYHTLLSITKMQPECSREQVFRRVHRLLRQGHAAMRADEELKGAMGVRARQFLRES